MKHTCIKPACANTYESEEKDPYYCPTCQEANKELAKRIDAQVASRPKRPRTSDLQKYEEQLKQNGIQAGGLRGVKVDI